MVKEFLSQKGVDYEERDVSANRAYAEEMVKSTGQMGVPVIIIDGQAVIVLALPLCDRIQSNFGVRVYSLI